MITKYRETLPTSKTILIVEDNPIDQKLLGKLIKKRGYRTRCASHGQDALKLCSYLTFDLILMNVNMPGLSGIETTKAIRRMLNQNSNQPIVGITGEEKDVERLRCLDAGMNDYYQKPLRMLFIDYILDDWLKRETYSFAVS